VYATVKPYILVFTPEAQIPRENIERKEVSVSISDLHDSEQSFSLDRNGFIVLEFQEAKHDSEVDWGNETRAKDVHYSKIVSEIEGALPETRYITLHHQINSKRR
jgi:hypothetical protein